MKRGIILMLITCLLFGTGCSRTAAKHVEGEYDVYYFNQKMTGLVKDAYEARGENPEELITELLDAMRSSEHIPNQTSLLDETIDIKNYQYENRNIQLNMRSGYGELERTREVLIRAGLVRTLIQIDGIDSVSFLVDGEPLSDSKGQPIGALTEQSFIENSGKEINSYKNETLILYFANQEATALKEETRKLYYNSNVSLEQVVVEQLLKGPKTEGCTRTLPENVRVMNVTVIDKICYVNFDKTFADGALSIPEALPIYSIVNSIIENCSVNKVQISVGGESDLIFRETMKLSELYKMNRDLIQKDTE